MGSSVNKHSMASLLRAALSVGLAWALAEAMATGVFRLSSGLSGMILLGGVFVGLLGGLVAWGLGKVSERKAAPPWWALLASLGLTHGLQSVAMASRDLGGGAAGFAGAILAVMFSLVCLTAALVVTRSPTLMAVSLAATIPLSSVLWSRGLEATWFFPLACSLPAFGALMIAVFRRPPVRHVVVLLPWIVLFSFAAMSPGRGVTGSPSGSLVEEPMAEAPNVLLISVDTLRADVVGDGVRSPGTPRFDELCAEGVYFESAIASASWTLPSHASLLTGMHPAQHGAVRETSKLEDRFETLAERLGQFGFETAAFTGGGFLAPGFGLEQGFEWFDGAAEFRFPPFRDHVPLVYRVIRNRFLPIRPLLQFLEQSGGLELVGERALDWLQRRRDERPFFLFLHSYQVHDYYVHQPSWDETSPDSFGGCFAGRLWIHPDEILEHSTHEEVEVLSAIYRRRVTQMDQTLGRLVDQIRELSGERELWIVLTSDHGEGFEAEPRRLMHGGRLHDDLLRVPLLWIAPSKLPRGVRHSQPVRLIDVVPTLLDLFGSSVDGIPGQSLVDAMAGNGAWPQEAWAEDGPKERRSISLRTPQWKLVETPSGVTGYHLAEDPNEHRTLSQSEVPAPIVERWRAAREQWQPQESAPAEFDEETLEHLRTLGYVD